MNIHLIKTLFNKIFTKNKLKWGSFRRLTPISSVFGYDRGKSINRYYIDKFLKENQMNITGSILEFGDDRYTKKYGKDKIEKSDVLYPVEGNQNANIICDITKADIIPSNTYDCIICTQTLQFIFDLDSALLHLERILKPGGVILSTSSGISQISKYDMDRYGEYWRFTKMSSLNLFSKYFDKSKIKVKTYGNVLIGMSYLHGLSMEELTKEELEFNDPNYQVFISVKAKK